MSESTLFRPYRSEDATELLALFNRVFGPLNPSLTPRSSDHWRWKFDENPHGNHSFVACSQDDGHCLGFVGFIPQLMICGGQRRMSSQACDHMVDAACRSGLRKRGIFPGLMQRFIQTHCSPEGDVICWGFPTPEAFRIGQQLLGYSVVRPVNMLLLTALPDPVPPTRSARTQSLAALPADTDELWGRLESEIDLAVVRNATYLRWRYQQHPDVGYTFLEARDVHDGSLRGLAIMRSGGLAEDVALIMEWLVPAEDQEATRALFEACTQHAEVLGMTSLAAWFPESSVEFDRFQRLGFRVRFTKMVHTARSFDRS